MCASVPRSRTSSRKSLAGGVLLGGLAAGLLALPIGMLLNAPSDPVSVVVLLAIPAMLTLVLCTGGIGIYLYDLDDLAVRICAWTTLGLVLFTGILGGELIYFGLLPVTRIPPVVLLVNVAGGGAVLGFLIGLYDAHQRLLYRNLRAEYDRTLALSQRLSVLARILRHDLRNHLNVIVGHADLLHDTAATPAERTSTNAIQQAGHTLIDISDTIHQFSRILSNPRLEETATRIELTTILRDAIETTQHTHEIPPETITVNGPPSVTVSASPFLQNAIVELLDNAIVHATADTPRVTIETTIQNQGDTVDLQITDNGPGIPDRELDVLEKDIETQLTHSAGVGLWLVRWVVASSDGQLTFDTTNPTGTTARIRLPTQNTHAITTTP